MINPILLRLRASSVIALLLLLTASHTFAATETYTIDPAHSSVEFKVGHFLSKVSGRFDQFTGTIKFDKDAPEKSEVQGSIDTTSINTNQAKRDTHLRTADFFDVEKFPKMAFQSKSWKKLSDNEFEVTGDLTLHGVTKPVALKVTSLGFGPGMKGAQLSGWQATGKIMRSDFGMTGSAPVVGNEVAIEINAEASKS